jgi:hypothetical protein
MQQNGRFIGQLCCGQAFCGFPVNDYYGRFDQAWNQVKPFLDPINSNANFIDGHDPFGAPPVAPVLNTVSPSTVQAWAGGTVTLGGSNFSGATQVKIGTTTLTAGNFTIVSPGTITFPAPIAPALGAQNVTVVNPTGSSAPKTLTFVEVDPPKLNASPLAFGGFNYVWTYAGGANDQGYLLISTSPATFPFHGFQVLLSSFTLVNQSLGPVGVKSTTLLIPAGLAGLSFHSQLVTFSGGFVGASSVVSCVILS